MAAGCHELSFGRRDLSLTWVQKAVAFRHRTVPSGLGKGLGWVYRRVCLETSLWDRRTRNGARGPSQAGYRGRQGLLSDTSGARHPAQLKVPARRAEMVRVATRKPASSRSQDHEQRTLDLPGCVRDFSEERKGRGKCPDSILS